MLERPPREVICCGVGWISEVCEMKGGLGGGTGALTKSMRDLSR